MASQQKISPRETQLASAIGLLNSLSTSDLHKALLLLESNFPREGKRNSVSSPSAPALDDFIARPVNPAPVVYAEPLQGAGSSGVGSIATATIVSGTGAGYSSSGIGLPPLAIYLSQTAKEHQAKGDIRAGVVDATRLWLSQHRRSGVKPRLDPVELERAFSVIDQPSDQIDVARLLRDKLDSLSCNQVFGVLKGIKLKSMRLDVLEMLSEKISDPENRQFLSDDVRELLDPYQAEQADELLSQKVYK
eukprot:g2493.t1